MAGVGLFEDVDIPCVRLISPISGGTGTDVRIEGTCEPRFERVRRAFGQNFERNEVGAAVGFMLSQPLPGSSLGPNPRTFGHPGAGGSFGMADPDAKIGFGYTMNQMGTGVLIDPRAEALIKAVYESLG